MAQRKWQVIREFGHDRKNINALLRRGISLGRQIQFILCKYYDLTISGRLPLFLFSLSLVAHRPSSVGHWKARAQ